MNLYLTLVGWAVAAALAAVYLGLLLWQAGDDQGARRTVPVRPVMTGLAIGLGLTLTAGMTISNIDDYKAGEKARADNTVMQIETAYTLEVISDTPAADITGGDRPLSDPATIHDFASGKAVPWPTRSGKPATIQLFSAGGKVVPVLTYDGKVEPDYAEPFKDRAGGASGFPQIVPLPALPAKS